jgi:hypothetical protein
VHNSKLKIMHKLVLRPIDHKKVKSIRFYNEAQVVFNYLHDHMATASMVSEATGIKQKNICRYKRDFEKSGLLWEVYLGKCKETKHRAWYLTTDPSKAPKMDSKQLELPF